MGLTKTASGARSFRAFCATIKAPETMQPNIFTTHVIPDKEDESFQPKDPNEPPLSDTEEMVDASGKLDDTVTQEHPQTTMEDQEPTSMDPPDELLCWNYRLGHLSFEHI